MSAWTTRLNGSRRTVERRPFCCADGSAAATASSLTAGAAGTATWGGAGQGLGHKPASSRHSGNGGSRSRSPNTCSS